MTDDALLKKAEDLYEQFISDCAAAEDCLESVYRWNTPSFKDLTEEERQKWIERAQ